MPSARPYHVQLHPEPPTATGKLLTPGTRSQAPEGEPSEAHSSNKYVCFPYYSHRRLSPVESGQRCPDVIAVGHESSRDAIARRHLDAYHRRESAGAEAVVDTEVGQRQQYATDDSWQCERGVGPGGGEIHNRDRGGKPANFRSHSGPGLPSGTAGVDPSSNQDTQSEGRRARFAFERPYLHTAASPCVHQSAGLCCGNSQGTTPKRTGDRGVSGYPNGGSVASAGSSGQELAGRRGLRPCGADFDYCASASSESPDGTGDSVCRHDVRYARECGATPGSRGCREQW